MLIKSYNKVPKTVLMRMALRFSQEIGRGIFIDCKICYWFHLPVQVIKDK